MDPDWSLLPPEMLQLISEKITSVDDYVYFRSVCHPWRLASTPHPRHLIPPFPWLNFSLRKQSPSVSTLSLYDFAKSRIHDIELPSVFPGFCGLSRGWIVLEKDKEPSFINPITKETKSGCFPSLAIPPTILGFARNAKTTNPHRSSNGVDPSGILKTVLTSSPADRDCILVAQFIRAEWELGFSRVGDVCWTILKLNEYGRGSRHIWDFKCKKDLVYVINNQGSLIVYDLRGLSQKIIVDRLTCATINDKLHLVIGEGKLDGVPLIVKRAKWSGLYEVFMCMGCKWRRVKNIGNVVLLVNDTTCEIVSLEGIGLSGWEGNHICYASNANKCRDEGYSFNFNIKIKKESIENGSVKEIPTSLGLFSSNTVGYNRSWFTPSLY